MPQSRWETVEALFIGAADLEAAARKVLLDDACRDDPTLRAEVEALLRADQSVGDAVASTVAGAAQNLAAHVAESRIGERVGAYRLIELLGHGGMGTVYLAERADGEYEARVAIKFVRGAHAAPELARRFRSERQILAGLSHPNIARLLDGGATVDGTPYLVLEYLEGESIDKWCDTHALGVRERVTLFLAVCDAVEYAHRANVVHRDIKPSNIIVTENGTPKLVDFGIARLLDRDASDATTTLRILTPAYASPEQVQGGPVTTATDVYSLGSVLFALVAGCTPIDLTGASSGEIERRVTAKAPPPLSVAAAGRGEAWQREISAPLDAVIAKALRKRPELRHQTAAEFADDLRAYLATPPGRNPFRAAWTRVRSVRAYRMKVFATFAAVILSGAALGAWNSARNARVQFNLLPPQLVASVPAGIAPVALDVNGDGRSDLVWNERTDSVNRIVIGLGRTDGSVELQAPIEHPLPPKISWDAYTLFTGDFDGDRRADLAWSAISPINHIYVALSAGTTLRFFPPHTFPMNWADTWRADIADLNGDGSDDLVFNILGNTNVTRFAHSNRDGTFTFFAGLAHPATNWRGYRRFIADADGDGRDDLIWNDVPVWSNRTYVVRSHGDRLALLAHQDHPIGKGWGGYTSHIGDVNGDGRIDLLWVKAQADSVHVHSAIGQSSAQFAYTRLASAVMDGDTTRALTRSAHVGDFNGDGRADLLLRAGDRFRVARGTRAGSFIFDREWRAGFRDVTAIADIDGDGRKDIIWMNTDGRLYVALAKSPS